MVRVSSPPEDHHLPTASPFAPDLHTKRQLWLKVALLTIWLLASFGGCFFARDLQYAIAGWPLGYWIASQGSVLIFISIVVVYAITMSRWETKTTPHAE